MSLSNLLYVSLTWLLTPWVKRRIQQRHLTHPQYLAYCAEYWGNYDHLPLMPESSQAHPIIWVHAVSVGETYAAAPLIAALRQHYPQHTILLTHTTATGRAAGQKAYADYIAQGALIQCYAPWDRPDCVRRFYAHWQPAWGLMMETEWWPSMLRIAQQQQRPMYLVNARLSEQSLAKYNRFPNFWRGVLQAFTGVMAQTTFDAERIEKAGIHPDRIVITGNLKFDVTPLLTQLQHGQQWRREWLMGQRRHIVLCASTRHQGDEQEEVLILRAWQRIADPSILLVIVPRHPERFDAVFSVIQTMGLKVQKRSKLLTANDLHPDTQVLLGDSMGEMYAYYRAADLAILGGSWLPLGGQNLIEATAVGCPVMMGPSMFNFAEVATLALDEGAVLQADDVVQAMDTIGYVLHQPSTLDAMRQRGQQFAARHQGAAQRTIEFLQMWQAHDDNEASA
jgi:3-deoxy-D-manno-octulosonic-acid transferase